MDDSRMPRCQVCLIPVTASRAAETPPRCHLHAHRGPEGPGCAIHGRADWREPKRACRICNREKKAARRAARGQ